MLLSNLYYHGDDVKLRLMFGRVKDVRISDELRGWFIHGYGSVRPSDITSLCPTKRDVWLLRHGARMDSNGAIGKGVSYHSEVLRVMSEAVRNGWEGIGRALDYVRTHAGMWALALATAWLSNGGVPPIAIEPRLPPAAGFTSSRPDMVVGNSPVEVAYVNGNNRYVELKRIELAAYSLILEALTTIPVDIAYLIVITDRGVTIEDVVVDDTLRSEALTVRDAIAEIISSKSPPPLPGSCPQSCPLRRYCLGDDNG